GPASVVWKEALHHHRVVTTRAHLNSFRTPFGTSRVASFRATPGAESRPASLNQVKIRCGGWGTPERRPPLPGSSYNCRVRAKPNMSNSKNTASVFKLLIE